MARSTMSVRHVRVATSLLALGLAMLILAPSRTTAQPSDPQPAAPAAKPETGKTHLGKPDSVKADPAEPQPTEALASRGRQYRALKGQPRGVLITSKGALETITAAGRDVRAFAIEGPTEARSMLAGAHLRLATRNLVPSDATLAAEISSEAWLNSAESPWIDLVIREVRDVRTVEVPAGKGSQVTLIGELTIRGVTRPVEIPRATLIMIPAGDATRSVADGDLLRLLASFEIQLADFGITNDEIAVRKRIAGAVAIAVDLVMATGK